MLTNSWVSGKYWVGSDGAMVTNAWVDGGKYWVGSDGKYNANKKPASSTTASSAATYAANSDVYHIYDCASAQAIKRPKTTTVADAQAKGLKLCKTCQNMSH